MLTRSELEAAVADFPSDPRIQVLGPWQKWSDGQWSLPLEAKLCCAPTEHLSEWTRWHLVLSGTAIDADIGIYPDTQAGIRVTFPHQDLNLAVAVGRPWRVGKPCLVRPASVFRRVGWAGEPSKLSQRLVWHIGRLLLWIQAAGEGTLLIEGDTLELPTQFAVLPTAMLGFSESPHELTWIDSLQRPWGFATITPIPGAGDTSVITRFMDRRLRSLRNVSWTEAVPHRDTVADAVWITLPSLIFVEPWQAASTWAQLTHLCADISVDLPSILVEAGALLRRSQRAKRAMPLTLLLGFPLQEHVGSPPQRLHWLAVRDMQLCGRYEVRNGFRSTTAALRQWDVEAARADRPLQWKRTANWAPDQLRKRGQAEQKVRSKSVLILGVGTLGAAVAENLLRMGMTKMALLDNDTLLVGNLSRHLLTLQDVGHLKVERMAKRLNAAMPDARVSALSFSFPPTKVEDIRRLANWDVVIDCTASDATLKAIEGFAWSGERTFVSLAMTWRAKGLFAYSTTSPSFPASDALARFLAVAPVAECDDIGEMEGIGCWHPVFPATADDVNLWAAIGAKHVRRSILDRETGAALYLQHEDGSVERKNA